MNMSSILVVICYYTLPLFLFAQTPAPIDQRISQLLSKMSLADKAAILPSAMNANENTSIIYGSVNLNTIKPIGCGNITGIKCDIISRNNFQKEQMAASSNNIPISFYVEALHSSGHGSTIFPVPIVMGSTWNKTLLQKIGETIAFESRIYGADVGFAPVLQVLTDPRYGRYTESYGGNPILNSHYAYYMSLGLNGGFSLNEYVDAYHINNQAKHFVGYAAGGKDGLPLVTSIRNLREVYLRPWEALVASGGKQIMASHNSVNGVPMHANYELLTNVMRNEFNWKTGLIASDCGDIAKLYARSGPWSYSTGFHIASDMNGAVLKALNAGMDLSLCDDIRGNVITLVNNKQLNISVVNRAVSNQLRSKFAIGLFDHPLVNISDEKIAMINNATARQLAKDAALQGIVLLKNENNLLPLNIDKISSIAVIGPIANNQGSYYGPYSNPGAQIVTLVDALNNNQNKYNYTVSVEPGCDAVNLSIVDSVVNKAISVANHSDYVILVVGDNLNTVGENRDRVGLELPGGQLYLMNEVLKLKSNKTIVVYLGGRPGTFGTGLWNRFASVETNGIGVRDNMILNNSINALLSAYHPGEDGGNALFEIIFGMFSPSGRLSSSWPQSVAHVHSLHSPFLKQFQGHENENYVYNTINPLFSFGFGLSYASIVHSKSSVIVETIKNCQWKLSINITNQSPMDSYEVIQIYYTLSVSSVVRNELELAGFEQVFVPKQSTISATVIIDADSLSFYDDTKNQWILEEGLYYIYDGKNAQQYNYWSTTQINIQQSISNPCKFWSNL